MAQLSSCPAVVFPTLALATAVVSHARPPSPLLRPISFGSPRLSSPQAPSRKASAEKRGIGVVKTEPPDGCEDKVGATDEHPWRPPGQLVPVEAGRRVCRTLEHSRHIRAGSQRRWRTSQGCRSPSGGPLFLAVVACSMTRSPFPLTSTSSYTLRYVLFL